MLTYLDRYLQGEHEQVWADLYTLGDAIRHEPLYSEALDVTRETMKRIRHNVELLTVRLNDIGFVFGLTPEGQHSIDGYMGPYNSPSKDITRKIAYYEALEGINSFPLSLRIFWETVGNVDFTGYYPDWPQFSDPLIIFPIEAIDADHSEWRNHVDEGDIEVGRYGVPISPDYLHKANVSGGDAYRIRVPSYSIDEILVNERHHTTLVNYLRICFRYGGFPGFHWSNGGIPKELFELADGLLPI